MCKMNYWAWEDCGGQWKRQAALLWLAELNKHTYWCPRLKLFVLCCIWTYILGTLGNIRAGTEDLSLNCQTAPMSLSTEGKLKKTFLFCHVFSKLDWWKTASTHRAELGVHHNSTNTHTQLLLCVLTYRSVSQWRKWTNRLHPLETETLQDIPVKIKKCIWAKII